MVARRVEGFQIELGCVVPSQRRSFRITFKNSNKRFQTRNSARGAGAKKSIFLEGHLRVR